MYLVSLVLFLVLRAEIQKLQVGQPCIVMELVMVSTEALLLVSFIS
jgi:hypothetical protein